MDDGHGRVRGCGDAPEPGCGDVGRFADVPPRPRLTVLSGPSGVGKGTVVARVRALYPHVWVSVSATTRAIRPGETDGVEYHFVDRAEFARMAEHGELLEWAEYAGNLYGTPRLPVEQRLAAGIPALLEIELQGARQVRESFADAFLVFLTPPSWQELERRLTGRGTEELGDVATRLERARIELAAEDEFDAVVVNDDIGRAAAQLVALIEAECG
jgi:guanylate kinase